MDSVLKLSFFGVRLAEFVYGFFASEKGNHLDLGDRRHDLDEGDAGILGVTSEVWDK